jgi:nucleoside-diphosphate-sugar epimerase
MRVLMIGGTRFIGPLVVDGLLQAGHELMLLHRGQTELGAQHIPHIHLNRSQLASCASHWLSFAPEVVVDMNARTECEAQIAVEALRGRVDRVILVSSVDVYRAYGFLFRLEKGIGDLGDDPVELTEQAQLRTTLFPRRSMADGPDDWRWDYDKILVERTYRMETTIRTTVLRLPYVYGPGDYRHRLFRYLPFMAANRDIHLTQQEAAWRSSRGYVADVAQAVVRAVENPQTAGKTYNVAESDVYAQAQWVRRIGRMVGWKGRIVPEESSSRLPLDWCHHLVMDTSRIRRELGYVERTDPDLALQKTIEWEQHHPPDKVGRP